MPVKATQSAASERIVSTMNGWGMLIVNFALLLGAAFMLGLTGMVGPIHFVGALLTVIGLILLGGYFTLQPNQARVLILFGAYKGTVHSSGFHWANPFYSRNRGFAPRKDSSPSQGDRNRTGRQPCRCRTGPAIAVHQALAARAQLLQRRLEGQRQARQSG